MALQNNPSNSKISENTSSFNNYFIINQAFQENYFIFFTFPDEK
jgi:hypothetical protein